MKKILFIIILGIGLIALPTWAAAAAGVCIQTHTSYPGGIVRVVFACTGSSVDGSIANTSISSDVMNLILGKFYLYTVAAYPTAGGTPPDAADVFILDAKGEDLLGSVDGGTTANKGANLIHATLTKTTLPYSGYLSQAYFPAVVTDLRLKVSNQGTVSAHYTIELIFAR